MPPGSAFATVSITVTPNTAKISQNVNINGSGYATNSQDDIRYVNVISLVKALLLEVSSIPASLYIKQSLRRIYGHDRRF